MNPFTDWKDEQQAFNGSAFSSRGESVSTLDPNAACWCAFGWLEKSGIDIWERREFSMFLMEHTGSGLIMSNDDKRCTPRQFEAAWDLWKAAA